MNTPGGDVRQVGLIAGHHFLSIPSQQSQCVGDDRVTVWEATALDLLSDKLLKIGRNR
ncbi:MAG TPA: hypothetical protein PK867_08535 [Pirellulales bacterium]|nr:hypothetical protein [Pirellulales bacterium]